MGFSYTLKLLLVIFITVQYSLESECCIEEEKLALLEIKQQFQLYSSAPNDSHLLPSWVGGSLLQGDCCLWERITCDPFTNRIVALDLGFLYQRFSWPSLPGLDWFQHPTPTSLEHWALNVSIFHHFKELKNLTAPANRIGGLVDDEGLCKLSSLQVLDLSSNSIYGRIPKCISNLTFLKELDLSYNHISGYIPSGICKLRRLQLLHLDMNNLNGELPTCIGNLSSLQELEIIGNQLVGSIPSGICELRRLNTVELESNHLIGELPTCIGNLSSLQELFLRYNQVGGIIPSGIGY